MEGLTLNDDEDYDFMDEAENGDQENGSQRIHPHLKYMKLLQAISERTKTQVLVELDDLAAV